jgi:hypothetical protein
MGDFYNDEGRRDEAEKEFNEALKVFTVNSGDNGYSTTFALMQLGIFTFERKQYADFASRVLAIGEKLLPETHNTLRMAYGQLASSLHAEGKDKEALDYIIKGTHPRKTRIFRLTR